MSVAVRLPLALLATLCCLLLSGVFPTIAIASATADSHAVDGVKVPCTDDNDCVAGCCSKDSLADPKGFCRRLAGHDEECDMSGQVATLCGCQAGYSCTSPFLANDLIPNEVRNNYGHCTAGKRRK